MERPSFDLEIHPTPAEEVDLPTITSRIPPEMERLAFLVGHWEVEASFRLREIWVQTKTRVEYRRILDDTMLEEHLVLSMGETSMSILAHWCWDRYREIYRMVRNDNLSSRSNIYEGDFIEDALVFTNLHSDTAHITPERRKHNRFTLLPDPPDRYRVLVEESLDGGENWQASNHYDVARVG